MENAYQHYHNFGDFNRKPATDKRNLKVINNENNGARGTRVLNNDNRNGNPVVIPNRDIFRAGMALTPVRDQNTSAKNKTHHDEKDSSYTSKSNYKPSQNNSLLHKHLERRHEESKNKIEKMRIEKINDDLTERKNQPKLSQNSKKIVDSLIKREINVNPRTERNLGMFNKSPDRIYNNNSKKTPDVLMDGERKITSKHTLYSAKENMDRIDNKNISEKNKIRSTKVMNIDKGNRDITPESRKRPSSLTTRRKNESIINKTNYNQITPQNNNTNDKQKYEDSVGKRAIDTRLKLQEYYSENKNPQLIKNKQHNPENNTYIQKTEENKKLLTSRKDRREEEPIKVKIDSKVEKEIARERENNNSKNKNEYDYPFYPKKMPLPAEKNFNLNIDFNQFDQFSPPSNQNLIMKNNSNIHYEYNNTFNKVNDQSSKYGMVDFNFAKRNSNINGIENYVDNTKQHYNYKLIEKQNKEHFRQEMIEEKFTRKSDSNHYIKDVSCKNYLYSKLLKTANEKVSLIPQSSKR